MQLSTLRINYQQMTLSLRHNNYSLFIFNRGNTFNLFVRLRNIVSAVCRGLYRGHLHNAEISIQVVGNNPPGGLSDNCPASHIPNDVLLTKMQTYAIGMRSISIGTINKISLYHLISLREKQKHLIRTAKLMGLLTYKTFSVCQS